MKPNMSTLTGVVVVLLAIQLVGAQSSQQVQEATIKVTEKGYEPNQLSLRLGIPARVTFVRETDATCGTEVVLPEYDIERKLPLDQPVIIEFTPQKSGEFGFACGMNMVKGKLIVSEN